MREATYSYAKNLFNSEQIKELNILINKNLTVNAKDAPAINAEKTSDVKFLRLGPIQRHIFPFIDYSLTANISSFGFDLHQLTSQKVLNYNSYKKDSEYSWHIDATSRSPISDIKLTCLLNLSEENFEGGDLVLFKGGDVYCKEFNEPGSAVVFPSFTNHKVNRVISGNRHTLALWMSGPKFR
jgi:predicted 2-oxoglutarate/Fe(II)-dependent dioxygenase YbiX|tara:strand:- start:265 stop:813 length:549 start_codon:yes stop_codon:yes gene_type:complete